MGRAPCCDKTKVRKGSWSPEEDEILKNYLQKFGTGGNWIALPQKAGLKRCGKSCRLRWLNYLRPNIKHGGFTEEEDNLIFNLYSQLGSRWSVIASHLPGRTDNDVKNHWNTKLKKKLMAPSSNYHNIHGSTASMAMVQHSEAYSTPPPPPPPPPPPASFWNPPPSWSSLCTDNCALNTISPTLMHNPITTPPHYPLPAELTSTPPSCQDSPSISSSCGFSSVSVDHNNNYKSWTGNGGMSSTGDLGFSGDFGSGFSHGQLIGFGGSNWSQERMGDEFVIPYFDMYAL